MEFAQIRASQYPHAVLQKLALVPVGQPPDRPCGYFEVASHVLCAKVNPIREHDKAFHLVQDVDAPHLFDAQCA
ncbi:hypothetical protein JCM13580A_32370 [Streptomyces drozdowiczii]